MHDLINDIIDNVRITRRDILDNKSLSFLNGLIQIDFNNHEGTHGTITVFENKTIYVKTWYADGKKGDFTTAHSTIVITFLNGLIVDC